MHNNEQREEEKHTLTLIRFDYLKGKNGIELGKIRNLSSECLISRKIQENELGIFPSSKNRKMSSEKTHYH